jgi:hypothetical protein
MLARLVADSLGRDLQVVEEQKAGTEPSDVPRGPDTDGIEQVVRAVDRASMVVVGMGASGVAARRRETLCLRAAPPVLVARLGKSSAFAPEDTSQGRHKPVDRAKPQVIRSGSQE